MAPAGMRGAAGNIGVPVTELPRDDLDSAVIEVSSYQAADFDGRCDIAVLTMLAQEHLDWHGSRGGVSARQAEPVASCTALAVNPDALDAVADVLDLGQLKHDTFTVDAALQIGNRYLARPHNLSNLAGALAVTR